jgi:hypothetical protein
MPEREACSECNVHHADPRFDGMCVRVETERISTGLLAVKRYARRFCGGCGQCRACRSMALADELSRTLPDVPMGALLGRE